MTVKIRSIVKAVQTREHGLAYVGRELVDFNFNILSKTFQPILEEYLFLEEEVDVFDEEGGLTGGKETQRTVVQIIRRFASDQFSEGQVNSLFNFMGQDILATYSFTEKFVGLLRTSLLLDTQSFSTPLYGIDPSDWEIDLY